MQDTYDPFSYLLAEIYAYDAGLRHWPPGLREHYLEQLLIAEAEEIAWGRRHLTVVHGPVTDETQADRLNELYAVLHNIARHADWMRIGMVPHHHFTITVAGGQAGDIIETCAAVAAGPGAGTSQCRVRESACLL